MNSSLSSVYCGVRARWEGERWESALVLGWDDHNSYVNDAAVVYFIII